MAKKCEIGGDQNQDFEWEDENLLIVSLWEEQEKPCLGVSKYSLYKNPIG